MTPTLAYASRHRRQIELKRAHIPAFAIHCMASQKNVETFANTHRIYARRHTHVDCESTFILCQIVAKCQTGCCRFAPDETRELFVFIFQTGSEETKSTAFFVGRPTADGADGANGQICMAVVRNLAFESLLQVTDDVLIRNFLFCFARGKKFCVFPLKSLHSIWRML